MGREARPLPGSAGRGLRSAGRKAGVAPRSPAGVRGVERPGCEARVRLGARVIAGRRAQGAGRGRLRARPPRRLPSRPVSAVSWADWAFHRPLPPTQRPAREAGPAGEREAGSGSPRSSGHFQGIHSRLVLAVQRANPACAAAGCAGDSALPLIFLREAGSTSTSLLKS